MGASKKEIFTVSGWYEGDPISGASQVYLSKAYLDKISENYTEEDFIAAKSKNMTGIGLIQGSIMFKNSNNIEERMNKVIEDSGYSIQDIEIGINWAYFTQMSQELDFMSTTIILVAFFIMMLTGYLIIYNIFQISIIGDIRFYGLLKMIGATKKQIRRLVLRQAFLLSCIGIPVGLFLGFIVGNLILPLFLGIFGGNQVSNLQIKANPYIFLFGALFSLITVFLSCRKPSKIAGSVSPIEAAKYSETSSVRRKIKKSKRGARISSIALSNLKRNKRKTIITILSLSLSVILMTEVVTFSKSFSVDLYLETMLTGDFTISSISLLNYHSQEDMKLPEDFYEAVNGQEGIEDSQRMYYVDRRINHTLSESGNQRFKEFYEKGMLKIYKGDYSNISEIELVIRDNSPIIEQRYAYDEPLLNKLKVLEGSLDLEKFKSGNYILVVPNPDNEEAFYRPGDKVELQYPTSASVLEERKDEQGNIIDYIWANDKVAEYEVMAVVDIPYSMTERRFGVNALTTILPVEELLAKDTDAEAFAASYWVEDEKEVAVQSFLEDYTTRVNPNTDFESKEELRDEISSLSMSINLVGGALSFIVGIIGIINFINTMLTSVMTRKREFAMMQSIGLTNIQLKRMLIYEGIYYIGYTTVISLVMGSFLSSTVVRALNNVVQCFEYQFTILPFVAMLPVFLLLGLIIPVIAYRNLKQSIVERLREE
jgi:putative ABC transport system permease protein